MMYVSASMLERATGSAAHLLRTGQIQQSGGSAEAMFRDEICAQTIMSIIKCDNVIIEAQTMESFSDYASMLAQYDEDGEFIPSGFDVGGSSDRILVRVAYTYSMITPLISVFFNNKSGNIPFLSTVVLQVEPYEFDIGA